MNRKVTFVGTGMIGAGLATCAVMHGYQVAMYDTCPPELSKEQVHSILSIFIKNGVCTLEQANAWVDGIFFTNDMKQALEGAVMVQESIPERIELKKQVYREIQSLCGDSVTIASSTSMLFPSSLSEGALYPENIIVGHPFNPAYLLPIMELCAGETGSAKSLALAKQVYSDWGKVPVVCQKEVDGFIANAFSWAAMDVCKNHVLNGICSVDDMDKAVMYGPGLRMAVTGQILTMSLGVQGGFRKMDEKYGMEPRPENEVLARGVDEQMANRTKQQGQDEVSITEYRDKVIIDFLKIQGLL